MNFEVDQDMNIYVREEDLRSLQGEYVLLENVDVQVVPQEVSAQEPQHHDNQPEEKSEASVYTCIKCQCNFPTVEDLIEHSRQQHSVQFPYICQYCGKKMARSHNFVQHLKSHDSKPPSFRCLYCKKQLGRSDDYHQHMRTHASSQTIQCSVCGKTFSRRHNLNSHVRLHLHHSDGT